MFMTRDGRTVGDGGVVVSAGACQTWPTNPEKNQQAEHHTLVEMDPLESFRATDIPDEHAGDDDDDEGTGGVRQAQCAQQ
eukprot:COSAG02_NODE_3787_length_6232_cov_22.002120_5_plen_80_part_00